MGDVETIVVLLLVLVAAASALARVLGVPYPILLVIGGSLVGFVPGVPELRLEPELVLSVFLPPLLYDAAFSTTVRDLRASARVITLSAVGLVLATTAVVAAVAHALVDGLPWAAAFALGAIVSPTDPLAATQIARRLGLPRRTLTVIEGESLVNDGSSLVVYQSAVAIVGGASFVWWRTGGLFVGEVLGGVAIGLAVAVVMNWMLAHAGEDQLLRVVLTLTAGYLAYLPAERLHLSGVLAAVTCGLLMGHRSPTVSTATSRLRNGAFWETLVFLLNAVLFVSVGLQLPRVLESQDRDVGELARLGVIVALTTIAVRLLWTPFITAVIRTLDRREVQRARRASWQARTVTSWCGLRGAVSLAAALALPADFPERDLLIFLALCVIWATLVGQGLTLPWVIRLLGVQDDGVTAREELHARKAAAAAAVEEIDRLEEEDWTREDTLERMRGLYEFRRRRLRQRAGVSDDGEEDAEARSLAYQRTVRSILDAQRRELVRLRDEGEIGNDALHAVERELDLEEERLDS
ncbi:Na+/H+ antiporter [Luteipulveratus sp. YIM 133132]|uniref:Na+/H+ antiporter n=1 Tax=Luteipulveratus flavus TaxID=3031728 RepID=UPI0023B1B0A5|nr:Na+/H+ antiporter [Luteipulveratus sp. YIM 133132]MDE9364787.1 Na+/H+ antiporter [Luteipulveratus sp. YIM 133132]